MVLSTLSASAHKLERHVGHSPYWLSPTLSQWSVANPAMKNENPKGSILYPARYILAFWLISHVGAMSVLEESSVDGLDNDDDHLSAKKHKVPFEDSILKETQDSISRKHLLRSTKFYFKTNFCEKHNAFF